MNLEESIIEFSIDLDSTNMISLQHQTKKVQSFIPLLSDKTGVYLYGYN